MIVITLAISLSDGLTRLTSPRRDDAELCQEIVAHLIWGIAQENKTKKQQSIEMPTHIMKYCLSNVGTSLTKSTCLRASYSTLKLHKEAQPTERQAP